MSVNNFLTVVCFLWTDPHRMRDYQFGPEHVFTLCNMVARHLTIPHEFVCITNFTNREFTEAANKMKWLPPSRFRLEALDMTKHVRGTVFARLMMRRPDIASILGRRILSLDLDCVIVSNIDDLVGKWEYPEASSVFWRNPNYTEGGHRAFFQTSIQLFTAGAHSELWTDFDPAVTPRWVNRRFGGAEQAWVSERLPWNLPYWTDADGVYGLGRLGGAGIYDRLPDNAKIVFTPGNREPGQAALQEQYPWIKEHYR